MNYRAIKSTLGPRGRGAAVALAGFEAWTPSGMIDKKIPAFVASFQGLSDAQLPVAFVQDILLTLLKEVISPFTDLRAEMLKDRRNLGKSALIAAAGQQGVDTYWAQRLMPVLLEASRLKEQGQATMKVVIPGARTASHDLKWHIVRVVIDIGDGYDELARIQELQPWFLKMGKVTDLILGFLTLAGQMANTARCALAKIGAAAYAPIGAAKSALDLSLRISAGAGLAYLLYRFRKPGESAMVPVLVGGGVTALLLFLRKKPPPPGRC